MLIYEFKFHILSMESWLLYEYSMLSVRTAESIYEALRFDGVLSFRFRFLKVVIFLGVGVNCASAWSRRKGVDDPRKEVSSPAWT